MFTQINGGQVVFPASKQFLQIDLTESITLSWPTDFQNANPDNPVVVANIMRVVPTAANLTITMPDATLAASGQSFLIENPTATAFNLLDNSGNLIATFQNAVDQTESANVYMYQADPDAPTPEGNWSVTPNGGGYTAVTSVGAAGAAGVSATNLTVGSTTTNPITTTGTLLFSFQADLEQLISFDTGAPPPGTGIAVRTAGAPTPLWTLRAISVTAGQLTIINGGGVAGNPTISLAQNILGIASVTTGNISIGGAQGAGFGQNAIVSVGGNNLQLAGAVGGAPAYTVEILSPLQIDSTAQFMSTNANYLSFQAAAGMGANVTLTYPAVAPTAGQGLTATNATQLAWTTISTVAGAVVATSLPIFTNTTGTLASSIISINANAVSVGFGGAATSLALSNALGGYSGFQGTAGANTNVWTLPVIDGVRNSFLTTSGGGSGTLSFSSSTTACVPRVIVSFTSAGAANPTVNVDACFNVTSVVWNSAGTFTVTIPSQFANGATCSMSGSIGDTVGIAGFVSWLQPAAGPINTFVVKVYDNTGALSNLNAGESTVMVQVYGS